MWCWYKRKFKNTFDQQSSSGPVYETVSSPQANVIEVETNKAYGYLNEMVSSPRAKVTELETNKAYGYLN